MAIANYTDLVAAVGTWMRRSGNATFTALVPDFIALFEADANRILRCREQEVSSTIPMTSGVGSLPADWLEFESVIWNGADPCRLTPKSHASLVSMYPETETGYPLHYCTRGTSIEVRPFSDEDLLTVYYAKVGALTPTTATNWLLSKAPDSYLFGCIAEANGYIEELEKAVLWKQRSMKVLDDLGLLDRDRYGGGVQQVEGSHTP
jgi:hypothetical protein